MVASAAAVAGGPIAQSSTETLEVPLNGGMVLAARNRFAAEGSKNSSDEDEDQQIRFFPLTPPYRTAIRAIRKVMPIIAFPFSNPFAIPHPLHDF